MEEAWCSHCSLLHSTIQTCVHPPTLLLRQTHTACTHLQYCSVLQCHHEEVEPPHHTPTHGRNVTARHLHQLRTSYYLTTWLPVFSGTIGILSAVEMEHETITHTCTCTQTLTFMHTITFTIWRLHRHCLYTVPHWVSSLTAISNTLLRYEYRCIQMVPLKAVKSKLSPPLEASSLKCALSASADPPQVTL